MNDDDSLLVHLGHVAAILVLSVVYVLLLSLGTVLKHAGSLLQRSATTAADTVSRVFVRTPFT